MKKFTKTSLFLAGLTLFTAFTFQAQNPTLKQEAGSPKFKVTPTAIPQGKLLSNNIQEIVVTRSGQRTAMTGCVDTVGYVGSTPGPYFFSAGGATVSPTYIRKIGYFQVFPDYTGNVVGVKFTVAKYNTANNPKLLIGIFDLSGSAPTTATQYPTPVPFITLTSAAFADYVVTFASPIPVSNGFAMGLYCLAQDSARILAGPVLSTSYPDYSYVFNSQSNMFDFTTYFGINTNLLFKPIITTSVNPTWLTAKTSTGCGIPAVYNFTNTTLPPPSPSYILSPEINPLGVTTTMDYGDGTAVVNNFMTSFIPLTHSYTTLGTYTAAYTQTYLGWTNNCAESKTLEVVVDNPLPSFTYNANGLTVTFNNTSQNISSYAWNFGDLSTSTQTDPSHTFSSPGTYVVELEGTAPCGKVRYSVSVVVSPVGIKEYTNINNSVTLFPNPASNNLQINNKSANELGSKIEIFNTVGATVKVITSANFNSGSANLDISDLSKGIYFIKLKSKEGDIVKSFVKE